MEELLKNYGWGGVIVYLVGKYGHILWKKHVSGNWISYKDLGKRVSDLETTVKNHLEKEAQEDIERGIMNTKIENQQVQITDQKVNIQDICRLLSEIKTLMIEKAK